MLYICNSLQEFNDKQNSIHQWRLNNIAGYSATCWANPDNHKHQSEDKYLLPLPDDYVLVLGSLDVIDSVPSGWFMEVTY